MGRDATYFAMSYAVSVVCTSQPNPVLDADRTATSFKARWNATDKASGYYLQVTTNPDWNDPNSYVLNEDIGKGTLDSLTGDITHVVSGLNGNTVYYYRLTPYFGANFTDGWHGDYYSATRSVSTLP